MTPSHSNIEDVLNSKTRWKILKLLCESNQLTTSEIAIHVQVNFVSARKHLDILKEEGLLTHRMFGERIRFYRLNDASPRTKALRDLIVTYSNERGCNTRDDFLES